MTYAEKLKDPRWQKKRVEVLQRDGFKCRDCGDGENTLHVHHCHYAKGGPWMTPSDMLLTLCGPCHETRAGMENTLKVHFAQLLADSSVETLSSYSRAVESGDPLTTMLRSRYDKICAAVGVLKKELK